MNWVRKFGLLLWKNYLLQMRHKKDALADIIIPIFATLFVVWLRYLFPVTNVPDQDYPRFLANDIENPVVQVHGGKYILYAPDSPAVRELMNEVKVRFFSNVAMPPVKVKNATLGPESNATSGPANNTTPDPANNVTNDEIKYEFIAYPDEDSLLTNYKENVTFNHRIAPPGEELQGNKNPVLAAVVFKNYGEGVNDIKYVIRFPASLHLSVLFGGKDRWLTERLYVQSIEPGPREPVRHRKSSTLKDKVDIINWQHGGKPGYWIEGFLYLQNAIENTIARLNARSEEDVDKYDVYLSRFPYPSYIHDSFIFFIQNYLSFFVTMSFIWPIVSITKSIVYEKEKRLKESMKMMGLPNWLHWSAWFTKSFILYFISFVVITFLYKYDFNGSGVSVLTYSSWSLIFVFFIAYLWTVITLGFLISAFFSDAHSSATASGVIFFVTYIAYVFVDPFYASLSKSAKLGFSLIGNVGLAFGCKIIGTFEGAGTGIQWSTIAQPASPDDDLTMLEVILMLFLDGTLYFLITLYIEAVFPGEYGVPIPWYFPCTKWYWFDTARVGDATVAASIGSHPERNERLFEMDPNTKAGIQIIGLTKIFGKKVAVNDLHLNFYENQVTALLGHNGAGKTTTMSMLTGLFPPTSGTALVNGFDIRTDMKLVRGSLGLCPQHDVLFDEMTVEEHLKFFALLKGLDKSLVKQEVDRMLTALMLKDKKNSQSHTLSGGMKRKLSVGIALVGGSQVVLLDEPTSGMDPGARRSTWDLITNEKKGRTIVLSTHFMDEADLLGDRVAIMAEGQVQCCGSSLFLKKQYGGGYHLIIVKQPNCQVDQITHLLQQRVPEVNVDQNIGAELSYSLPDEKSNTFPEMFEELERRKEELGIASYGCSITQMEEVFIRVGKQAEDEIKKQKGAIAGETDKETVQTDPEFSSFLQEDEKCQGFKLACQQLRAMFVKKYLYSMRHKRLNLVQIVIPVALILLTMLALRSSTDEKVPVERELDLIKYASVGPPTVTIQCGHDGIGFCAKYQQTVPSQGADARLTSNFRKTILDESKKDLRKVTYQYIVGVAANNTDDTEITGFFNNQPLHSPPVALNLISNAILREVSGNDAFTISVSNYPLPFSKSEEAGNAQAVTSEGFPIGSILAFGMSFVAASFVVFIIKERETKSKHLQFVSGVKFPIFWLAHFLFDVVIYLIPCIGVMIVVIAVPPDDFKTAEMQGYFFIVLLMHGVGVIPLMYLFSFRYAVPSSGYVKMLCLNWIIGQFSIMIVTSMPNDVMESTAYAYFFEWLLMLFPNFGLGFSIGQLSLNRQLHKICPDFPRSLVCARIPIPDNPCCKKYPYGYLSWHAPGIGRHMIFLFITGAACSLCIYIIESKIIQKVRYENEASNQSGYYQMNLPMAIEDFDVAAEKARIWNTDLNQLFQTDMMILKDLTKDYSNFLAVDRLCLGVRKGECFGLLGVNGAGKTTTFKMLTGDISITQGDAFIHTKSVKSDIKEVQRVLGYCPQFDALIPELTGRETIRLFARLRGVPENKIDRLVDSLGKSLLFSEHLEKPCGTYSGGNKRKLSTSLALVGSPAILFLDEPTTGMDPVARRHLWNTISQVREHGTSVVLTSHSMEECEALCSRLAIMVNGKFRCLGSSQHLKNKFGDGYTLIVQIQTSREERTVNRESLERGRRHSSIIPSDTQKWEQDLVPLRNYIETNFPGCILKDVHPGYVHYHIPNEGATWGGLFRKMEEAKHLFTIEAYSVGQTSLEQIFLSFAKGQFAGFD